MDKVIKYVKGSLHHRPLYPQLHISRLPQLTAYFFFFLMEVAAGLEMAWTLMHARQEFSN